MYRSAFEGYQDYIELTSFNSFFFHLPKGTSAFRHGDGSLSSQRVCIAPKFLFTVSSTHSRKLITKHSSTIIVSEPLQRIVIRSPAAPRPDRTIDTTPSPEASLVSEDTPESGRAVLAENLDTPDLAHLGTETTGTTETIPTTTEDRGTTETAGTMTEIIVEATPVNVTLTAAAAPDIESMSWMESLGLRRCHNLVMFFFFY